jgi:hypothetical protein
MSRRLPDLPKLAETGRHYLDGTQRARLASPGIERYVPAGKRGVRWVGLALVVVIAATAAVAWVASR